VNYEEVSTVKIEVLREVFRTFMANQGQTHLGSDRWASFQEYIEAQGQYLEKYSTFCALHDYFGTESPLWPAEYRDPESNEVKKFQRMNEEPILFWKYVQWQLEEQLRGVQEHARSKGMMIGLYNDEALAVDRNGADFWALRDFFHDGFRVGAPPDAFAPDGQDWGFPPPDRDRLRSAGYEPFIKKLETSCKFSGALRIDHVMQLYHLFWIPEDGKAKDGVYVKDFESDLLNLIALVSQRTQTIIIGEDLGTVPFDFRDRLMEKGIFSYRVFYFERDKAQNLLSPGAYPESALVTISTHDLPTLAGFWCQSDIDVRKKIGQITEKREEEFRRERTEHKAKIIEKLVQENFLPAQTAHAAWESPFPTDNLHKAVLAFVLNTPSRLVVINQEDIFLDTKQQNFPGTTSECPNWSTKMRFTLEDFYSNDECRSLWERLRDLVEASGRSTRRDS
jgi:4-alpha-glucanotransferase